MAAGERDDTCLLCRADKLTPWYHEDDVCWVADCTLCATPMVVWRWHGTEPSDGDREHMLARLGAAADQVFDGHYLDGNMRNIPDHFHMHARPEGGFFGHGFRRDRGTVDPAARRGRHVTGPGLPGAGGPGESTPGTPGPARRLIPVGAQPSRADPAPLPVVNLFEAVGGQPFFDELVERFYRGVESDPVMRPMYPDDLTGPKRHLALFLGQYWGGPTTYSDERGHPRLRMRHAPFAIGHTERDAWLRHMAAALDSLVDELDVHPAIEARMLDYFGMAADGMVNVR